MDYIKGTFFKRIYQNEDNGYTVGLLKIKESSYEDINKTMYFVGTFNDLKVKSNYIMYGNLVNNNKYGEQFMVSSYELVLPEKKDELIEFLCSDLFPIGEKTAKKIVDKFKEETLDIILNDKNKLLLIPKLSQKKIDKLHDILEEYQYTSSIAIELNKMGFTSKQSLTILKKYNTKTMDIINDNIYNLVETFNYPFIEIDEIALNNYIIESHDYKRLKALIIHVLNEITFETGDTYSLFNEIYNGVLKYIKDIDYEELESILLKLNMEHLVIIKDDRYYLKTLYDAEDYIKDKLCMLNDKERKKYKNLEKEIDMLEKDNDIIYDETQKLAIKSAINNNLTIITGGPGTGKTTIIKAIVSLFRNVLKAKDEDIALLAPTGRAAKRMSESTRTYASTIHKYLKWDKDKNMFCVTENCKTFEKYIIIDEVSMIDTVLFEALLKGITNNVKIVMVGDYHQLPSVSQGQVLKDLIDSEMFDVIKLNNLYRQNSDSYITQLATEIKNKDLSDSFYLKKDDYNFIEGEKEQVVGIIENIVKKAIDKGYNDKDIQVLVPMYKTINGIDNLNIVLQKIFNPQDKHKNEINYGSIIYREGDKILQLVNDNDNNVYNGDIGYIVRVNNEDKSVTINYDDTLVTYTKEFFINFRHGYAISIHKSQGGEFKMVIMPIVNSFNRMLYNKLIYTAITRAKEKLLLVGDISCFINGIKNDYVDNRKTSLKEKIIDKYNN